MKKSQRNTRSNGVAGVPRATSSTAVAILLLALNAPRAGAVPSSHVEQFNSTTFKDGVNTTADWNTAAGKLKLPPYQPTLLGTYTTPFVTRPTGSGSHGVSGRAHPSSGS